MAELHRLTVKIDADVDAVNRSMNDAAKQVNNFSRKMDGTVALAAQRAREAAQAAAAAMEQQYQKDMARIKEGQARGFLTAAEARKAGREAAQAYNQGMIGIMDKAALTPGALSGKTGGDAVTKLAGSLKSVDAASGAAARGMGRAGYAMTSLARQAAGAHPATAQLSYALGGMALGSGVMIGVMAGTAALAIAWRKMTDEARNLKKAAEDAAAAVAKVARDRDTGGLTDQIGRVEALGKQYSNLTEQIDRLKASPPEVTPDAEGDASRQRVHTAKLLELEQQRAQAMASFQEALRQYSDANLERADRERKAEEARLEAAKRAAEEARRNRTVTPIGIADGDRTVAMYRQLQNEAAKLRGEIRQFELVRSIAGKGEEFDRMNASIAEATRKLALLNAEARQTALTMRIPAALGSTQPSTRPSITAGMGPERQREHTDKIDPVVNRFGKELENARRVIERFVEGGLSVAHATAEQRAEFEASVAIMREHNRAVQLVTDQISAAGSAVEGVVNRLMSKLLGSTGMPLSPTAMVETVFGAFMDFGFEMLSERSKRPAKALEQLAIAADRVNRSLSDVPLIYNVNLARHRVNSAGATNIGTVVFQVDSASTWDGIKRQMSTAASRGDPVARRLILQTAPGS
jgi:hypothetical protein